MHKFQAQAVSALLGLAVVLGAILFGSSGGAAPHSAQATYVEAMIGSPHLVNPLLANSDTDTDLSHLLFSGLTRVSSSGRLEPDMASGWQVSPDTRVFTFTLRPNLLWQDGKPVTSGDVLFTTNILREKDFPGDPALAVPWRDAGVTAPDESTVVIKLSKPDASFIQYTTLGILPKHLWSDVKVSDLAQSALNRSPIGSGPWRYAAGEHPQVRPPSSDDVGAGSPVSTTVRFDDGVLLEPFPTREGAPSGFSSLWFRPYPNYGAALTAFTRGEVHGLGHIPADRLRESLQIPGADAHTATLARYAMLLINTRSPIFSEVETRRALALAIDKAALARVGEGLPASSPILPHSWAYSTSAGSAKYDPEAARAALDSAGWVPAADGIRIHNGMRMSVVLSANGEVPQNVAVAHLLQEQLLRVGIELQPAMVSRDSLLRDYLAPGSYHLALVNWAASGADPDLYPYWHSSQNLSGLNFSGWVNPAADKDLQDARATSDLPERTARYYDFQSIFASQVPAVILYNPTYTYLTRSPAAGVTLPAADLLSPSQRFNTLTQWRLNLTSP